MDKKTIKRVFFLGVVFPVLLLPLFAFGKNTTYVDESAATEGLNVTFTTQKQVLSNEDANFSLFVHEASDYSPITNVVAGGVAVVGVREDLSHFFHTVAENRGEGVWEASNVFENPGVYKAWSKVTTGNEVYAVEHKKFPVSGEGDIAPEEQQFSENVIVGSYQVELVESTLSAGKGSVTFVISDVFGRGVELEEHMGAMVHFTAFKNDLTQMVYTQPANVADDELHDHAFLGVNVAQAHVEDNGIAKKVVRFDPVFLEGGVYKIFVEFKPVNEEEPVVAGLYMRIDDNNTQTMTTASSDGHEHSDGENANDGHHDDEGEDHFTGDGHDDHVHEPVFAGPWYQSARWWGLFISSLIMMVLLSLLVKRYLEDNGETNTK